MSSADATEHDTDHHVEHDPRHDPRRLVFVGGLHRSGTTPLARALAEHPSISGLTDTGVKEDEGQHLQHVYVKAKLLGGPGRFAFDPRAHLTEDSPLVTPENAEALWQAWEPYWDLSCPLLVEKSPPNLLMGRFLQATFPGSAFVVVVRHPVVVALSTWKWRRLASRRFQNHTSLHRMVEHWLVAHRVFLEDLPHLERTHVLRYEDLVSDPAAELAPVQRLLGLDDPIPPDSLTVSHSTQYERRWEELAKGSPFERRNRKAILRDFADDVAEFGYDLEDLSYRAPSIPALTDRVDSTS